MDTKTAGVSAEVSVAEIRPPTVAMSDSSSPLSHSVVAITGVVTESGRTEAQVRVRFSPAVESPNGSWEIYTLSGCGTVKRKKVETYPKLRNVT